MISFLLLYLSGFVLIVFVTTVLINGLTGPFFRKRHEPEKLPFISVLIPARNEENNIEKCLNSIRNQNYPSFEIIVLDDQSEDNTAAKVVEISELNTNIKLIKGKNLPQGWLGKNWACWQLAQEAKGEILFFVDADTWHERDALKLTVGWMQKYGLGLFSSFPQQIYGTFWEKLLVPFIDVILYTFLPLWAVYYYKSKSFAAANGQWIAISRDAYSRFKGHESVKDKIVEDVELARLAKENDIKIITSAGTGVVYCRMYENLKQTWRGLTKIMYGIAGNNFIVLLFFIVLLGLAFIVPYFLLFSIPNNPILLFIIFLMFLCRLVLAVRYKHPLFISLMFLPLGIVLGMMIGVNSFIQHKAGKIIWKNRKVNI